MIIRTMLVSILLVVVVVPASGQSLSDRLNHVRQEQARQQESGQDPTSLRAMLGVLLYTDIDVNFEASPVRDVFRFLADRLELNIIARYSDDRNADGLGIDPETPVSLSLEGAPALTVLELVLEQVGAHEPATWQMRHGFVEVGTLDRLSVPGARKVKVYPIDDLLYEPPNFTDAPSLDLAELYRRGYAPYGVPRFPGSGGAGGTINPGGGTVFGPPGAQSPREAKSAKAQELLDFIIQNVEPMAWEANGGEYATIRYFDGALIVRAPDYIHRQIGGYPKAIKPKTPETTTGPKGSTQ